jgi:hypothetical protein
MPAHIRKLASGGRQYTSKRRTRLEGVTAPPTSPARAGSWQSGRNGCRGMMPGICRSKPEASICKKGCQKDKAAHAALTTDFAAVTFAQ